MMNFKALLSVTLLLSASAPVWASNAQKELAKLKVEKPVERKLGQSIRGEKEILSKARAAYKRGDFKTALNEFSKIPTSSDRWPLAREEMAWTSLRMKELPLAAAQVRSLTNDYLKTQIDLEPYLLQSIVQLYSCDYNAVFNTLKDVKRQMGDYVGGVEGLSKGVLNTQQMEAVEQMVSNKTFDGLTPEQFHALPRRFYLDAQASKMIRQGSRAALIQRLTLLAKNDHQRNHKILQHLHLVEVEAIQRAFIPNEFGEKRLTQIPAEKDLMVFNGDKELWADEVDKTQADLYMCDSKTGRTL